MPTLVSDLNKHRPGSARTQGIENASSRSCELPDGSRYFEKAGPLVFHHTIDGLSSLHNNTLNRIHSLLHGAL